MWLPYVRTTPRNERKSRFLFLLMDIRPLFLRFSSNAIYSPCILHIPQRLVHSAMLWRYCPLLSCGHDHRSSTRLAVCRLDVCMANAQTSMVLTIASPSIHVCPVSIRRLWLVWIMHSVSIRAISSGFCMVSVHRWPVRHRFDGISEQLWQDWNVLCASFYL